MRAMRAEQFSGYEGLKLVELPKPAVADGKVLVPNHRGGGLRHWTIQSSLATFTAPSRPLVLGK